MINLDLLENSLKRRWQIAYDWKGLKQNDVCDKSTKFIYNTRSYTDLLTRIQNLDVNLKNYALNRWYNFWSAKGVEQLFSGHKKVSPNKDKFDKFVDFKLEGIPFDHKSSVFPAGFKNSFEYAQKNERKLIDWFYKNQSQEGRKHFKNRLFVVFYDGVKQEHWKLKAEMTLIKEAIDNYVDNYSIGKLYTFDFDEGKTKANIIWVINK